MADVYYYAWLLCIMIPIHTCNPVGPDIGTCTVENINQCPEIRALRRMWANYGKQRYRIKDCYTWTVSENGDLIPCKDTTGNPQGYYSCDRDSCEFYDGENNTDDVVTNSYIVDDETNDDNVVEVDRRRRKRNIVESCCEVTTSVVQVDTVVNVNDVNDVWYTTIGNNSRPTFTTRECTQPGSECAEEEGICITIQDVHSVFSYKVDDTTNLVEFKYLPVTFNVGCECRATPYNDNF